MQLRLCTTPEYSLLLPLLYLWPAFNCFSFHTAINNRFTTSPQSQSRNLGGSATLHCTISSNPQATITWLFNGGDVADGTLVSMTTVDSATRSTLTISSLEHEHGGQYRCLATNALLPNSAVYSDFATLMLIGKLKFISRHTLSNDWSLVFCRLWEISPGCCQ